MKYLSQKQFDLLCRECTSRKYHAKAGNGNWWIGASRPVVLTFLGDIPARCDDTVIFDSGGMTSSRWGLSFASIGEARAFMVEHKLDYEIGFCWGGTGEMDDNDNFPRQGWQSMELRARSSTAEKTVATNSSQATGSTTAGLASKT